MDVALGIRMHNGGSSWRWKTWVSKSHEHVGGTGFRCDISPHAISARQHPASQAQEGCVSHLSVPAHEPLSDSAHRLIQLIGLDAAYHEK
jgi:hypothetical protein